MWSKMRSLRWLKTTLGEDEEERDVWYLENWYLENTSCYYFLEPRRRPGRQPSHTEDESAAPDRTYVRQYSTAQCALYPNPISLCPDTRNIPYFFGR